MSAISSSNRHKLWRAFLRFVVEYESFKAKKGVEQANSKYPPGSDFPRQTKILRMMAEKLQENVRSLFGSTLSRTSDTTEGSRVKTKRPSTKKGMDSTDSKAAPNITRVLRE